MTVVERGPTRDALRAAVRAVIATPAVEPLTPEQDRFMLLHAKHMVIKWHWMFQESTLRAYSDKGATATITRRGLSLLIEAGLVELYDAAGAGVKMTPLGQRVMA